MSADEIVGWTLLAVVALWVLGAIVGEVMRDAGRRVDYIIETSLDPRPDYEANKAARWQG